MDDNYNWGLTTIKKHFVIWPRELGVALWSKAEANKTMKTKSFKNPNYNCR